MFCTEMIIHSDIEMQGRRRGAEHVDRARKWILFKVHLMVKFNQVQTILHYFRGQ